jgi:N-acetylneuraminic acid mutarotase
MLSAAVGTAGEASTSPADDLRPSASQTRQRPLIGDHIVSRASVPEWTPLTPVTRPIGRGGAAIAHDPSRDLIILFGGTQELIAGGQAFNETWVRGAGAFSWTRLSTVGPPSPRTHSAGAVNAKHDKFVIFGGTDFMGVANSETWMLDLATLEWRAVSTPVVPGARYGHAMVYDDSSDRIIMFGGANYSSSSSKYLYDNATWSFDLVNSTWSPLATAGQPVVRMFHSLALDTTGRALAIFGGITGQYGSQEISDPSVLFLANLSWTTNLPTPYPSERYGSAMAYDPSRGMVYVFGGATGSGTELNDTWSLDPSSLTWSLLSPLTRPIGTPNDRLFYDKTTGGLFMHRVWSVSEWLEEPWFFDPSVPTWNREHPEARSAHASGYSTKEDKILVFSGSFGGLFNETWKYDPSNNSWERLAPPQAPAARAQGRIVYLPDHDRFILFGGQTASTLLSDTWEFDPKNVTWTRRNPTMSPSPRTGHGMVYDSQSRRVILFGGSSMTDETWSYDYSSDEWKILSTNLPPVPRENPYMTYDTRRDLSFLFGGSTGTTDSDNETWTFDYESSTWSKLKPGRSPEGGNGGAIAYDEIADRMVVHESCCVEGYPGKLNGTWVYDPLNTTWSPLNTSTNPRWRHGHSMAYAPAHERLFTFGGINTTAAWLVMDDVWSLSLDLRTPRPPRVVETAPRNGTSGVSVWENVTVRFDLRMDPAATAGSISLNPPVVGPAVDVNGTLLRWTHLTPLSNCTPYSATISRNATSEGGVKMSSPFTFSFTTACPPPQKRPVVQFTVPSSGATGVATSQNISVRFDQPMEPNSTAGSISVFPPVAGSAVSVSGSGLYLNHTAPLVFCKSYNVTVSTNATAANGERMERPYDFSFVTECGPIPERPRVLGTSPANGSADVDRSTDVTVYFSLAMEPTSTATAFLIAPSVAGGQADVSGTTLRYSHTARFEPRTHYTVTIDAGATAANGMSLVAPYSFEFITVEVPPPPPPPPPAAPTIVLVSPPDGANDVPIGTTLSIIFSEPMDRDSVHSAIFTSPPIVLNYSWSNDWTSVSGVPATPLAYSTNYTVSVTKQASSAAGAILAKEFVWSFTTSVEPEAPPSGPGPGDVWAVVGYYSGAAASAAVAGVVMILAMKRRRRGLEKKAMPDLSDSREADGSEPPAPSPAVPVSAVPARQDEDRRIVAARRAAGRRQGR